MGSIRQRTLDVVALAACVVLPACRDEPDTPELGPDCAALIQAASRAQGCDPSLAPLAESIEREPDEDTCRSAVRALLQPTDAANPGLRSVHARSDRRSTRPLEPAELERLHALPRPATVLIEPDISPEQPGILPTRATLDTVPLDAGEAGRLSLHVTPGARTLQLEHGGEESLYCLELRPCETLQVTAHGAKLARHPDVRPGRCS